MTKRSFALVAVLVGIVCITLAVLSWAEPAQALPAFLPGH